MSDRITWEVCPACGKSAALGWKIIPGTSGEFGMQYAVEFDCPSRCQLTGEEMNRAFGRPVQP